MNLMIANEVAQIILDTNQMTCKLDIIYEQGAYETTFYVETTYWIVISCKTCNVPMAILKRHSDVMTLEELNDLVYIYKRFFPEYVLRTQARKLRDHIHFHFVVNDE